MPRNHVAALIGIDTLGAVSSQGGQALTWLIFSAVTFFLPYGLLTAEIGSTFTKEGGMVGAWIVTILPLAYTAIASFFILWPAASTVTGVGVSRLTYPSGQK